MPGKNCYIVYVLGDGSTKESFQVYDGSPTGFGADMIDFLKEVKTEEIVKLANLLDTINWVKWNASFLSGWRHRDNFQPWRSSHLSKHQDRLVRISDDHRQRYAAAADMYQQGRWSYGNDCGELVVAFGTHHLDAWGSIISGDLRFLNICNYETKDHYLDYCYHIDFRKRTLKVQFWAGPQCAYASFDALMEDLDLLGRIEDRLATI